MCRISDRSSDYTGVMKGVELFATSSRCKVWHCITKGSWCATGRIRGGPCFSCSALARWDGYAADLAGFVDRQYQEEMVLDPLINRGKCDAEFPLLDRAWDRIRWLKGLLNRTGLRRPCSQPIHRGQVNLLDFSQDGSARCHGWTPAVSTRAPKSRMCTSRLRIEIIFLSRACLSTAFTWTALMPMRSPISTCVRGREKLMGASSNP